MSVKIVIIGAGSISFSRRLILDCLAKPALQNAHYALVDIDAKRLDYALIGAKNAIKSLNLSATVSAHSDRAEALPGATAIMMAILVGGYEAIQSEIDIPMKYGLSQCIGDTLGPGAMMRALRTLPTKLAIANDIMKYCPKAIVLNYTNPMSILSSGIQKAEPGLRYVGLCHSVQHGWTRWANLLKIPKNEINFLCAGINHQAWYLRFEHNGKDLLPAMRELAVDEKIWTYDTTRMEYLKHFGYPVTESSGHCSEYNPWFRTTEESRTRYCADTDDWNGRHGFIKDLYSRENWEEKMKTDAHRDLSEADKKPSNEYGSQIIDAYVTGNPFIFNGNVRNNGLIDNLPYDCNVEVPCLADKNGILPTKVGKLPSHLAAINRTQVNMQELAVEAVLEKDIEKVFYALAMDPLTGAQLTLDQIRDMIIELLNAHKKFIPEWAQQTEKLIKPQLKAPDVTAAREATKLASAKEQKQG